MILAMSPISCMRIRVSHSPKWCSYLQPQDHLLWFALWESHQPSWPWCINQEHPSSAPLSWTRQGLHLLGCGTISRAPTFSFSRLPGFCNAIFQHLQLRGATTPGRLAMAFFTFDQMAPLQAPSWFRLQIVVVASLVTTWMASLRNTWRNTASSLPASCQELADFTSTRCSIRYAKSWSEVKHWNFNISLQGSRPGPSRFADWSRNVRRPASISASYGSIAVMFSPLFLPRGAPLTWRGNITLMH